MKVIRTEIQTEITLIQKSEIFEVHIYTDEADSFNLSIVKRDVFNHEYKKKLL